jgi:transcriptional regulator with XRE-family HTH domain
MENGRRRIHAELLCDIADVLGVSTDYLLGRTKVDESAERELGAEPYYPERDYGARPDKDGHQNFENQQETELGTYGKKK